MDLQFMGSLHVTRCNQHLRPCDWHPLAKGPTLPTKSAREASASTAPAGRGKTQVTFDWEILGSAKQFKTYYQNQGFIRFD